MKTTRPRCPAWLLTCYRISLRVYPAQFRAEYGALMEQAFADRYASFAASGKLSEKVRFAFDTLWDSSQSLCTQHWHAVEAGGFARLRFLLLLLLFVPLIMFHQTLISKTEEGFFILTSAPGFSYNVEIKTYRSELSARLRQHGDADSLLAARILSGQLSYYDLPVGEALSRVNLQIAREVMVYPFKPSWIVRFGYLEPNGFKTSDTDNVYGEILPRVSFKQLKACRAYKDFGDNNPACVKVWRDHRQEMQFSRLMSEPGYRRPEAKEIITALEQNKIHELELHYIMLNNNLQNCKLSLARNSLNCDKPTVH